MVCILTILLFPDVYANQLATIIDHIYFSAFVQDTTTKYEQKNCLGKKQWVKHLKLMW